MLLLRTFALPRIDEVAITKTKFARPADFSPEQFFSSALGVVGGTGDHDVVIRFAASVAERVREREWHSSQQLTTLPDGALELRLRLGVLTEVEQWVLGWGATAEVLAPPALRDRIRETVAALVKTYQG